MAEKTLKNPYKGVNAHLNSLLQTPGTEENPAKWHSFHANHIAHIADFLNDKLPANYLALSEESLQVFGEDFEFGGFIQSRRPDVTIYGATATSMRQESKRTPSAAAEVELAQTLYFAEAFEISAVVIRDVSNDPIYGRVVARIELLSPSNKPGGSGYAAYSKGRNEALYSHVPLIEIDYLHETALPMNYRRMQAYYVVVSDPRPDVDSGKAKLYGFDVDAPFPVVDIPLAGSETLTFDFGAVYHHTFERGRRGMLVDYTMLPARFETYSAEDQARIQAVMERAGS